MADHRAERRRLCGIFARKGPGQQHRNGPLGPVQQQRQRRGFFVAGAQHIGRADIARPDIAQVAQPHQPRQQHAKSDGADDIARQRPKEDHFNRSVDRGHQFAS